MRSWQNRKLCCCIKMSQFIKRLLLCFCLISSTLGYIEAAEQVPNLAKSKVFIHTSRNNPSFEINGKKTDIKSGDFLDAESLKINCDNGQLVTLVFANRLTLHVKGPALFKIVRFEQMKPFEMSFNNLMEASSSRLEIEIESGDFYVVSTSMRATSRLLLKTPFGVFEPKSELFYLSCKENENSLTVLEGQSTFCGLDGKTDFIQQKEIGRVERALSKQMYPLKAETLSLLQEQECKKEIAYSKTAFNSIYFFFDKDGNLCADRLTPKEFLIQRAKYDYRR